MTLEEKIIKVLIENSDYREDLEQILSTHFKNNPETYMEWKEWFEPCFETDFKELVDFFEEEGFNVHLDVEEGSAEIEKWTDGGVDMIINLNPFTKDEFIVYVNDFDVDELIDLHRESQDYKNNFTISQSVEDFTNFHNGLKSVVSKINDKL